MDGQLAALAAELVGKILWFSGGLSVGVALEWQFGLADRMLRRLRRWSDSANG